MAIRSKNKTLMCKVFPSSLGLVAMRWFNSLEEGYIHSFEEFTRAFGARFATCSRVLRPLDSLLLVSMKEGTKPEEALVVGSVEIQQVWRLFVDGAANKKGSR